MPWPINLRSVWDAGCTALPPTELQVAWSVWFGQMNDILWRHRLSVAPSRAGPLEVKRRLAVLQSGWHTRHKCSGAQHCVRKHYPILGRWSQVTAGPYAAICQQAFLEMGKKLRPCCSSDIQSIQDPTAVTVHCPNPMFMLRQNASMGTYAGPSSSKLCSGWTSR
jgi:hypothetical protein